MKEKYKVKQMKNSLAHPISHLIGLKLPDLLLGVAPLSTVLESLRFLFRSAMGENHV